MKQLFIAIITLFILIGCGTASKQYLLSADTTHLMATKHKNIQIGVDKVSVPGYLEESKIAIKKSASEIEYRSEIWAVPTAKSLTDSLILSLQKSLSNPNVYLFPWDIEKERGKRVKVTINELIYSNGIVSLEATYFIKRIGSSHKKSYLYSTRIASGGDTVSIVQAMGILVSRLVMEIARKI
jgi:uncharacterized lipoprotein YmbA